jgi:Trk K+ transport system NAD-binding subunit
MQGLNPQIVARLRKGQEQRNLRLLIQYVIMLVGVILVYTAMFEALMYYEERSYSWWTGLYWTLTTMSTLGFGDITFQSDPGRVFSVVVLLSGIVLLLVLLPYTIIRYLYLPRAPRQAPKDLRDHVVVCHYDGFAPKLVDQLTTARIPFLIIEPDATYAHDLHDHGLSVISGPLDSVETYVAANVDRARMVIANCDDATNTNITLTIREVAEETQIVATAIEKDAVDILQLAGANKVIPLHEQLGEYLASRVTTGAATTHVNGRYEDLIIAEFPVQDTPLVGRTLRDTRLRQRTGLSVVGCWERGHLHPASPDLELTETSVPVIVGTEQQLADLDAMFVIYQGNENPVLILGGGRVGRAATRALSEKGVATHVVELDPDAARRIEGIATKVFVGNAIERELLTAAGIDSAPSAIITTHDDAINIYLTAYFRRLNPDLRIISRISHDRNLEAIHRAGADHVLSSEAFAVKSLFALLEGREVVILAEDVDLFVIPAPTGVVNTTLAASEIGARTGMSVIAVRAGESVTTNPTAQTIVDPGAELVMLGTPEQRREFERLYA